MFGAGNTSQQQNTAFGTTGSIFGNSSANIFGGGNQSHNFNSATNANGNNPFATQAFGSITSVSPGSVFGNSSFASTPFGSSFDQGTTNNSPFVSPKPFGDDTNDSRTTFGTVANSTPFGPSAPPFGMGSDAGSNAFQVNTPFGVGSITPFRTDTQINNKNDTIRIAGLPAKIHQGAIESALAKFGTIVSVKISKKGCAYAKFQTADSAQTAARAKIKIMGTMVRVSLVSTENKQEGQSFSVKMQPLPPACENEDLYKALPSKGLLNVHVVKREGRAVYGFANYSTKAEAQSAVSALKKGNLGKVQCSIRAATTPPSRPQPNNIPQQSTPESVTIINKEQNDDKDFTLEETDDVDAVQHKTVIFNHPKKQPKEPSLERTVQITAGIGGDVDDQRLKSMFTSFGTVVAVSKAEGLVVFEDSKSAELAVKEFHGLDIFGHGPLTCRIVAAAGGGSSPTKQKEVVVTTKTPKTVRFNLSPEPTTDLSKDNFKATALIGECNQMCPEAEIKERVRFKELDAWEKPTHFDSLDLTAQINAVRATAVKKYKRSDAGSVQNIPALVRPPKILEATLNHLIQKVMSQQPLVGDQSVESYLFLWDRLRAIRKDFILQNFTTGGLVNTIVVKAFERMARFFIVMERRLANHPDWHDGIAHGKHNAESLSETLTALIAFYEMAFKLGKSEEICSREPEFTAYWILFFADHEQGSAASGLLTRLALERPRLHAAPAVVRAAELRSSRAEGNYARFIKIARSAPYTVRCLIKALLLDDIRAHAYAVLAKAYPKSEALPVEFVQRRLCYDTINEAFEDCQKAGLSQIDPPNTMTPSSQAYGLVADLEQIAENQALSLADVVLPSTRGVRVFYDENDQSLGQVADVLPLPPAPSLPSQDSMSLQLQKEEEQRKQAETAKKAQEDALRRRQQEEEEIRRRQQEEEARRLAQLELERKKAAEEEERRIKAAEEARQLAEARRQAEVARRAREEYERTAKKELDEARARQRAREAEARRIAEEAQAAKREKERKKIEAILQKKAEEKRQREEELAREVRNQQLAEKHYTTRSFRNFVTLIKNRRARRALDAHRTAALWLQRWRSKTAGIRKLRAAFTTLVKAFARDPGHTSRPSVWIQSLKSSKALVPWQKCTESELIIHRVNPFLVLNGFNRTLEQVRLAHPDQTFYIPHMNMTWRLSLLGGCSLSGGRERCWLYTDCNRIELVPGGESRAALAVIANKLDLALSIARLSKECTHLAIILRADISIEPLKEIKNNLYQRTITTFHESNLNSALDWLALHTATPVLIAKVSVLDLVQAALPQENQVYSAREACQVFNKAVQSAYDCASRMQPEPDLLPPYFFFIEQSRPGLTRVFESASFSDEWNDESYFFHLLKCLAQSVMPPWDQCLSIDEYIEMLDNDVPANLIQALHTALFDPGSHSVVAIAAARLDKFAKAFFYKNLAHTDALLRPKVPTLRIEGSSTSKKRILSDHDLVPLGNKEDATLPPSKRRSLLIERCRQLRDDLKAKQTEDDIFDRKLVTSLRTGALRNDPSISSRFLALVPSTVTPSSLSKIK